MSALAAVALLLTPVGPPAAASAVADTPGGPTPAAHAALFWSGGRTWWVSDESPPRLWGGDGWLVPEGQGVRQFRLRTGAHAPRPSAASPIPPAPARWTRFESAAPDDAHFQPLTEPPAPTDRTDEEAVLQFTGDAVTLARFKRGTDGERRIASAGAATRSLPDGGLLRMAAGTDAAVRWFAERFPRTLDRCVNRATGLIERALPGAARARWLVLGPASRACEGQAHLLPLLRDTPPVTRIGDLEWRAGALFRGAEQVHSDVVDVRPSPDGTRALVLVGEAIDEAAALRRDLFALDPPCARRRLTLWRAERPDELHALGEVARLDGLRWREDDAAFREVWLRPEDDRSCPGSLEVTLAAPGEAGPLTGQPGPSAPGPWPARRCQLDRWRAASGTRAWSGPADLSASVRLVLPVEQKRGAPAPGLVTVEVDVHDPERDEGDEVWVWLGGERRPSPIRLVADGTVADPGKLPESARVSWGERADGYRVRLAVPETEIEPPLALTVRVDDGDPDTDDAPMSLWAVGAPIGRHNTRATPVEIR